MRSTLFFSSSLFALQCIYPLVLAMAIPDEIPDEIPDDSDPRYQPIIPPDPEPPSRPCDPFCNDPTYQLRDQVYPDKENLWVITPGRPGIYQSQTNPDIRKILGQYLDESLPYLLAQTVTDSKRIPGLTKWGRRLLVDATLSIPKEKDVVNTAKLQKYINTVAPKAACGFFAAAAVPILGVAADTVFFANQPNYAQDPNSFSTTHDQDYFLQPAVGPLAHAEFELSVHYSAKVPALFGTNPTTQEGRDIYLRSPATASKYRATPQSAGNPTFKNQIRDLLHQFGQTKQWAAVDYIDTDFQLRYLLGYCKVCFQTQLRGDKTNLKSQLGWI